MKKDDAVFNTMPLFCCRDNTDVIYFGQDGICQFDISQKTFSNAAMYGNDIARKLYQYVEGKSMFKLCSREKC